MPDSPPDSGLSLGPRRKRRGNDPLVHHGRHFGRTVHALCSVHALLTNGLLRHAEERGLEDYTAECSSNSHSHRDLMQTDERYREREEEQVYQALLNTIPGLRETVSADSDSAIACADAEGISGARSDDTKSLKGAVLDWLPPRGQALTPPLARNVKSNRGFHHPLTGALLCPAGLNWAEPETQRKLRNNEILVSGDQWPLLLYEDDVYDENDPWKGLLRHRLLVYSFKHIFTSPSSVEREVKATRSGNARIHGMTEVTKASLCYVATQLRFALCSASVFCRNDQVTDSQRFYNSLLQFLNSSEEQEEVNQLLEWWNRQVFPGFVKRDTTVSKNSALAALLQRRKAKKAGTPSHSSGSQTGSSPNATAGSSRATSSQS